MARRNIKDGTEVVPGYSRAVKIGQTVHVSGTTALDQNGVVAGGMYEQTLATLAKIRYVLQKAGGDMQHIVRLVSYCTDITQAEAYARATVEALGSNEPASTLVEVRALMTPEMLIEIEAYAELPDEAAGP